MIFLPFANRIVFSDSVRAISLPTAAPGAALEGSLGGFGYTKSNAESVSDTLLVASLVTVENSVCTDRFSRIPFTTHFCANGRESIIPGLISNICAGDNGAGFYTGDGMITTTTTTTTTPDPEDENGEGGEGGAGDNDDDEDEILQLNDESVSEQVEPTLVK